jgi:hypothetical protein
MTQPKQHQPLHPIKTSICPSLTNTSKISYKIATDTTSKTQDSSNLYFQIIKNSATGKFSEEWIAYNDVKSTLPIGTFPSVPLRTLYRNKSLNTPGFLLAALLNEGVVEKEAGKRLLYRTCPDDAFLAEMQQLIDAEIDVADAVGSDKATGEPAKSDSAVSAVAKSHTTTKKTVRSKPQKGALKTAKSLFPASSN